MEEMVRSVIEHPLVAIAVCFSALLLVYFLFRSLIKLALILILVAILIGGYFYLQYPESRPASLKEAVEKAKSGTVKAVDQGKSAYEKGKGMVEKGRDVYEKGKEWVDKGKALVDKEIEKGRDAIEKERETKGDLGKVLDTEKESSNRQKP